jgi:hypothetical protein
MYPLTTLLRVINANTLLRCHHHPPDFTSFCTMRASLAFVASTALLECVSGHFSFVDIRSQIACDFYAGDGPHWLLLPIFAGANYSQ